MGPPIVAPYGFWMNCGRATLGYVHDEVVETVAVSNATRFERRLETVRDLESAMQEAADHGAFTASALTDHFAIAVAVDDAHVIPVPLDPTR